MVGPVSVHLDWHGISTSRLLEGVCCHVVLHGRTHLGQGAAMGLVCPTPFRSLGCPHIRYRAPRFLTPWRLRKYGPAREATVSRPCWNYDMLGR